MFIHAIEVEGFGVWGGLRIEKLPQAITVFHGPNEAGKSTLLEFIRAIFYGLSPRRRQYLPPRHGGQGGGMVEVTGPQGRFLIYRRFSPEDGHPEGRLELLSAEGVPQSPRLLKLLLAGQEEIVFDNIFAVGLQEMQELATLADTEAAQLLYNLAAGLDRISLAEVLHALETSRNRLIEPGGGNCRLTELLAERDKVQMEMEQASGLERKYTRLTAERNQLDTEIRRLEAEMGDIEALAHKITVAWSVRRQWFRRKELDQQLALLAADDFLPQQSLDHLNALDARLGKMRKMFSRLKASKKKQQAEFAHLKPISGVYRLSARVTALSEQMPWFRRQQEQLVELAQEVERLDAELKAAWQRLEIKEPTSEHPLPELKKIFALRAPAKQYLESRRRWRAAQTQARAAAEAVATLSQQIQAALNARHYSDLASALERAGNIVSCFRRRSQIEEQLQQFASRQAELEERNRTLLQRQPLPPNALLGIGVMFVSGVMLLLAGLFLPASFTGALGWPLALLGLTGSVAAGVGKIALERSYAQQLNACQKQRELLDSQIRRAQEECAALDARISVLGVTLQGREAAERELAALEDLSSQEVRLNVARQEAAAAECRAAEALAASRTARRRWQEALAAAALPKTLQPKHLGYLLTYGAQLAEKQRRLCKRREELAEREQAWRTFAVLPAQLAAECGLSLSTAEPLEQLEELAKAVAAEQAAVTRRKALLRQAKKLRRKQAEIKAGINKLLRRRERLLIKAGVQSEDELRERALLTARVGLLRQERDTLQQEIEAALAGRYSAEEIDELLQMNDNTCEARRNQLAEEIARLRKQIQELSERRGRINEQLEALIADNRLAAKRLELSVAEERIREVLHEWRVFALVWHILDIIRRDYETHRQPETLQRASGYSERLTQGRYRRVWTPVGDRVLRVDDAEGRCLSVEALSRGTREQLFLALRLALADCYARRGVVLPLVLDDVLVNFDGNRGRAAAEVLVEFAAAGHQLLFFTCHEHILRWFQALGAPIVCLPDNALLNQKVLPKIESPEQPRSGASKSSRPPRRRAAVKSGGTLQKAAALNAFAENENAVSPGEASELAGEITGGQPTSSVAA